MRKDTPHPFKSHCGTTQEGKGTFFNIAWDGGRWEPFAPGFTIAALARGGGVWAFSRRHVVYRLRNGRGTQVTMIPWAGSGQRDIEAHLVETPGGTLWAYGGSFDVRDQQDRVHLAAYRCA